MDYSIFIYLILTALVVALGWFVNLPAGRMEVQRYGRGDRQYCGLTRKPYFSDCGIFAAVYGICGQDRGGE